MVAADQLQAGVLGLLGVVITVLFARRAANKVATDNARANRESRFEENLQKRYESAMVRNSELQDELQHATAAKARLEQKVREQALRLKNLLEMLGAAEREEAERWIRESEFAPFDPAPQRPQRKRRDGL